MSLAALSTTGRPAGFTRDYWIGPRDTLVSRFNIAVVPHRTTRLGGAGTTGGTNESRTFFSQALGRICPRHWSSAQSAPAPWKPSRPSPGGSPNSLVRPSPGARTASMRSHQTDGTKGSPPSSHAGREVGLGLAVWQPVSKPTGRTSSGPAWVDGERTRQALLAEVFRSKSRTAQLERGTQAGTTHQTPRALLRARRDTLEALENYSTALGLRGWPTPPKMAREIQLLRSLCGIRRPGLDT